MYFVQSTISIAMTTRYQQQYKMYQPITRAAGLLVGAFVVKTCGLECCELF